MKTRLTNNIDGYPLTLALLIDQAYSGGVDLLSRNINKESVPDFSVFSVFWQRSL